MNSIELFSGIGGLAMGLQLAGFNHAALYEKNDAACRNIEQNIKNGFPIIKTWSIFKSDVRLVRYQKYAGKIQLVSGGPPCQPFSIAGKHKAHDDTRDMFPEAVRAIREIQPQAFIFENVQGLLRKSFQTYFNYILLQLQYPEIAKSSYQTWQEHLEKLEQHHTHGSHSGLSYRILFRSLNAADYGVPQKRQRVIIVGFRSDCAVSWSFPEPTHAEEVLLYSKWISGNYWREHNLPVPSENPLSRDKIRALRQIVEGNFFPLERWRTVRDAVHDLPQLKSQGCILNHEYKSGAKSYAGHSGSFLDEPSKTIKAGVHGVPGGENMLMTEEGIVRYYTVRECARLQTFPDEYIFFSSYSESVKQIGNAVPVTLARVIGSSIYNSLREVSLKNAR